MTWQDRVLYWLRKIPYATVYNLQPWTHKTALNLNDSLQWPSVILKKLVTQDLLKQMILYPYYPNMRNYREKTFYTVNDYVVDEPKKGGEYNKINASGEMALSMAEHESALMDIFLAFLNLYPDCEISIDTKQKFPYKFDKDTAKKYLPDAVIRLRTPNMKNYHFIIELERTKTHAQIRNDKFAVNKLMDKFQKYGLSKHTKYLYVYTYELYNVFWRPCEYSDKFIKTQMKAVEYRLDSLIKSSSEMLNDSFRFLPFHKFHALNKSVWLNSKREKVSILDI